MYAENNGVKIWYEEHGQGDLTLVMVHGFQITHSGCFDRTYVPHLSRHMRVITLDLRGNGKSDQPETGYDLDTYVEDVHAVIEAARLEHFAMAGHSLGVSIVIKYNALHPGRASHLILISGAAKMVQSEDYPKGMPKEMLDGVVQFWEAQPEVMLKSFIEMLCTEKYSLRFKELIWDWAHETTPTLWSKCFASACFADVDEYLQDIDIPCLIIHGTRDKVIHPSASQYLNKKITGSSTFLIPDAGHIFAHTWPQVSRKIFTFLIPESPLPSPPSQKMTGHRILWISSPIGLGHVKRDFAILSAIREKMPDLIVHWLCVDPVRSYLKATGEVIHPMSEFLMDESKHFENNATAYALNATEAYWYMDRILNNNFMVFTDALRSDGYDLVVGDESWEVHEYLHHNPALKTTPFVFLTDFIGASNVSEDEVKQAHVANVNGNWIEMRKINPRGSDLSIFIGEPEDVPDRTFGEGLPNIREWTKSLFSFSGYILPFAPRDYANRQMIRRNLGFSTGDKILLVAVGGTSVGRPLIEKCLEAHKNVREIIPDLQSIFLCGPRIDSQSFGHADGVEFRSFIPDPVKLYAACDLAVIQGGLSTAMELTALARPFLYFPLKDHFEQQDYVDYRLKNYRAGVRMDFDHTSVFQLAEAIAAHIGDSVNYKPVPEDGANKVASMITGLLGIS
jgi:pimeloyl-ACP methyl ester carboxylesterase/UDP:flavonoid glycosyltransferase YjiC (YdhE family)